MTRSDRPPLLLATGNAGKVEELRRLLAKSRVDVLVPADLELKMDVDEDGATFLANAQKKAREYAAAAGMGVLADDSGLVVSALDGRPGVESARYGGPGLDAAGRNRRLLEELAGEAHREARYICVVCLAAPGKPVRDVFMGSVEGRIGRHPVGEGGFGYDPVFVLPDGRTMAELPGDEKDAVSHRARAVREMLEAVDLAAWARRAVNISSPGLNRPPANAGP